MPPFIPFVIYEISGERMDKKKSLLNVFVSVGFKMITMVMVIFVKRLLIQICGNEVNGLNALYLSIISFLAVTELGVGSAITFCMYRPIVEGDNSRVSALYILFRQIYRIIGIVILTMGLILTPFLHHFAADYAALDVDLRTNFMLMLISVVLTYFFGAKLALINAYKNNYISTAISSGGLLLQYVFQIVTLLLTGSFSWYLISRTAAVLAQWLLTEIVTRRKYGYILNHRAKLDSETRREVVKNIKAMFMHNIGYVLVNAADSFIISVFLGVMVLGSYSNYAMIMTSMLAVLKLVFSSLTSIFGHLYVKEGQKTAKEYCERFHLLNFAVGMVFFLGYYAVADNLVAILFGAELVSAKTISLVITINGFVQFMRSDVLTFREATGTFYYDRWKPLAEGVTNVILSILFVKWIGVVGVIAATIVTNLLICHIVEPYVLYRHAFAASPCRYYLKNYGMILLFCGVLALLDSCMQGFDSQWTELLVNGCISVGISVVVCTIVILFTKERLAWIRDMKRG